MSAHSVTFDAQTSAIQVPSGTLMVDAARQAGIEISQPCGGQGRCGRCAVQVTQGKVRSRSTLRLTADDIAQGYVLACQAVIEGDITVHVPAQDRLERRLTTDRTIGEVSVPAGYDCASSQAIRRVDLSLPVPSMDDQSDDWSRLQTVVRAKLGITSLQASLPQLQKLGTALREAEWRVRAVLDLNSDAPEQARLIALRPAAQAEAPLWAAVVDIGTTTVTLWLVDLMTGQVRAQVSEYNQQISRGEDVISRIIYAGKNGGAVEVRGLVTGTINQLLRTACKRVNASPEDVVKATIAGNSAMIHLLLGLNAQNIRLAPFITSVNHIPLLTAREVGLELCPDATIDCLPGVASFVGSDISSGVYSSGMDETDQLTLFMDVGTNGEIVLGNREWLVTCACSAGPAFEGAGVQDGMRATEGAIEEVWIAGKDAPHPYEPNYRVIGNGKPRGLCGSGLLSLLAELFQTGLVDKRGNFNSSLNTPRVRLGEHGYEYVVAWGSQSELGRDLVFTAIDLDNLLRAKAAIYAGFTVLADSIGVPLETVEQVLIGGSFGKYINVEKAIQIGLLPDMPWEQFQFLGNTSVKGAYYALLNTQARQRLTEIASRMTYLELSADNTFYEAFMSAMFLPHTDLTRFPSVVVSA
jgi:uncharacterized 2Fe-2S/4Fe-4S cluster protein (DUF4445 family)